MSDMEHSDVARCPACGDAIDYCQGHGEIGDPSGYRILQRHDNGDHVLCALDCEDECNGTHDWQVVDVQRLTDYHAHDADETCKWRNRLLRDVRCRDCEARSVDSVVAWRITIDYVWEA